ncbi:MULTISPECIES: LysR family transcriptional regulator [Corallincola]|uniref:HTH-type transcriptional regulator MetR n=2 Tax=Corallincola TaxID=1775176 RepID=A0ABY1WRS6_9GAMM|nr:MULTISPECIES: LysR family transcriptional regulator [Corallincola]TAA47445.1 LysR family transcriptional regulator [Corallincola spongiicola]TCI05118.1 LysR family transcriptional regulator [Corallincola luteus]
MLDRHHLNILRAIDQHGTLTEAAIQLCLTQSALTHAIKKLEQKTGVTLWQKHGRRLQLTEAGSYLLSLANRLLPQFEHAERTLQQFADGQRGSLRIGMECHPCYRWLLKVVSPYMQRWPDVDLDVRQEFQFGGISALFSHDIDLLITPDPIQREGVLFSPVFEYEQVLVVHKDNPLSSVTQLTPEMLSDQTLITYPVAKERLDIFSQFLQPAQVMPKQHKTVETADIMLQMVAAGRAVSALPAWLFEETAQGLPIEAISIGQQGIHKQIAVGIRQSDADLTHLKSFVELARQTKR